MTERKRCGSVVRFGFRKSAVAAMFLAACLAVPSRLPAATAEKDVRFDTDISVSPSWGSVGFVAGEDGSWKSQLEWPLDGALLEIRHSARGRFTVGDITFALGVRGHYGRSLSVGGTGTDSDWDETDTLWAYSEADTDVDVTLWDMDLVLCVYPPWAKNVSLEAGVFVGYGEQRFDVTDSNMEGYMYDMWSTYEGNIDTCDLTFSGVRLGAYATWTPVEKVDVSVDAVVIPSLSAEADAYWMLRGYAFWLSAEGVGVQVGAKASYRIADHWKVFAGLHYTSLIADSNGLDSGVENGEQYWNLPYIEEITAQYTTVDFGLSLSF